ncbi:MAG TPA: MATE family efflux transporter [Longimicrobiaceae bacterium]|jgi:MATE family multidrug resistance protein|nr:MATE family efflux transporter [Longimicrobiaceae bacterium]
MPVLTESSRHKPARAARPTHGRRRRGLLYLHETRALARLAGPIVVSQLGAVAMTITDTIMVGPLGAPSLAAAGLGSSLQMVVAIVCMGVVMGMTPLVSRAWGAGEPRECRRVLVQGLWIAAALSVPLVAFCWEGERVALALGQQPEVARLAGGFMRALAVGLGPFMLFMALRQYLDGIGRTKPAMVVTFLGIAVNVAGNFALIYGVPGWVRPLGVVGSGWSTTIVRWAMLAVLAGYVALRPELTPRDVSWRPVRATAHRIAAIGLPIGAQNGAEIGIFACAAVMMGWIGPVAQAAHQVTLNIASATFMVALGTSIAGSIRVGQHVGAGSPRGVKRSAVTTYALVLGFMGLCALSFLAVPRWLIGLYTHDPAIVTVGTSLLFMAALFQLFDGAQVAGLSILRGMADTRVPMLITIVGYWLVGFPVAYYLGFARGAGPSGVWAGLVISLAVVAAMLAVRVRRVVWA